MSFTGLTEIMDMQETELRKEFYDIDLSGKFIKVPAQLPESCTNNNAEQTEIQDFFRDANVLITGGTGFLGKVLLEKLLVSCPNIGNIYLLIREKKEKTIQERVNELFSADLFIRVRELVPNFRSKVFAINGDCEKVRLGLSDVDYELLTNKVAVIFHGAATIRFDEKLKTAAHINVGGTLEVIKLAKECNLLKSLMHVSTAYSNCTSHHIDEKFYPPAMDYQQLLDIVDKESDDVLEKMTAELIKPWPNTYTFTKQIAEDLIRKNGKSLPMGVFRPTVVTSTYKEPLMCWTDNLYNLVGVIVGVGTGVLRTFPMDRRKKCDIVPVDMAINGLIAAAWNAHENLRKGNKEIKIFNYVSSVQNAITYGKFVFWIERFGINWPTGRMIWYPVQCFVGDPTLFYILHFLLHTIPGFIIDTGTTLIGRKPRMRKIYEKVMKFAELLMYFATQEWEFTNNNTIALWESLSIKDRAIYPFDTSEIDWKRYFLAFCLGARVFALKDDIDTLPEARKTCKRFEIAHRTVLFMIAALFAGFLFKLFSAFIN